MRGDPALPVRRIGIRSEAHRCACLRGIVAAEDATEASDSPGYAAHAGTAVAECIDVEGLPHSLQSTRTGPTQILAGDADHGR